MKETTKLFIIGLVAGSVALAFSFVLRIFAGGLFVPELAAQTLFSLTPGGIESQSVETLGSLAKYSAFAGATAVNLILYGLLGILLHGTYRRLAKRYVVNLLQLSILSYSAIFALSIILLKSTELQTQPLTIELVSLYLLPPHIAFGFILYFMFQRQAARMEIVLPESPSPQQAIDFRRRQLLRTVVAGAIVSVAVLYGVDLLFSKPAKPSNRIASQPTTTPPVPTTPLAGGGNIFEEPKLAAFVASEVTLTDRFYRIDTDIITPSVDVNNWKLKVKGLVNNPLELTYESLRSVSAVEEYATLECVSNKIGDDLISTALWRGIPLKSILEKAQVKPEATYVVFRCYDGYDVGIPLERGLSEETILAYEMNGIPLPAEHGFPLRAVVPGLYGMMNPKWITEIELVNQVYEGFWQRQGWSNNAEYQTHSTIAVPGQALESRFLDLGPPKVVVGDKVSLAGIAFAGDRGISKVEVSMDGGKSWETASIKEAISKNTWVLWVFEWNPPAKGRYSIMVRATDKTGKLQTAEPQKAFPSGATGYHAVDMTVEAAS